jgi:hypothetical protein
VLAESQGFDFVSISDHYHPWIDEQGHAPFVWQFSERSRHAPTASRSASE